MQCAVCVLLILAIFLKFSAGISQKGGKYPGNKKLKKKPPLVIERLFNVVGLSRLELLTPTMSRWCSNQLSYSPKILTLAGDRARTLPRHTREDKTQKLFFCALSRNSPYGFPNPRTRSAFKSLISSNPTAIRIKFSVIPASAFCSGDKRPWVVVAG